MLERIERQVTKYLLQHLLPMYPNSTGIESILTQSLTLATYDERPTEEEIRRLCRELGVNDNEVAVHESVETIVELRREVTYDTHS